MLQGEAITVREGCSCARLCFFVPLPPSPGQRCPGLTGPGFASQPMEIFVDDETKLTLHGLQQYYVKLKDNEKNRKLFDLLDVLEFNQVPSGSRCCHRMGLPVREGPALGKSNPSYFLPHLKATGVA